VGNLLPKIVAADSQGILIARANDEKWKFSGAIFFASILIIAQYILAFFVYKLPGIQALQWIGWVIWVPSLIFGVAPIFILRRSGGVAKGKSYVETTRLVDTSLYAIVRHPQYLGGILFNLMLMLLAQHWLVILLLGIFRLIHAERVGRKLRKL